MQRITGVMILFITCSILILTGCGKSLLSLAEKYERGSANLVEKNIQIDDHNIVYLESGEGEQILLVHGFGGDKDNWTRFAAELTGNYHIISIDLPGFGESSRIDADKYDIESQTERLYKFCKAVGFNKFHLAGNSMGGWISAQYAVKHPEMVASLILVDAGGVAAPIKSEFIKNVEGGFNPLLVNDIKDYDRLMKFVFFETPYIPGPIKDEFARIAVQSRKFNDKVWVDIFAKSGMFKPEIKKIVQPTLIIWGDKDRVLDVSGADVFMKEISGSEKYILKDCGHLPMAERPEETAEVFMNFIKKHPADSKVKI